MKRVTAIAASLFMLVACLQGQSAFDSAKAWSHLQAMVNIGPRPAGSAGLRQTRAYITRQIAAIGLKVEEQPFVADTPVGKVDMVNLIVRLPGKRPERILFTGHYDTKPMKNTVFVGASDGASSAAMLIELARVFKDRPREFTYEFVWLDGEEAFCLDWNECGKPDSPDNTYGSRYYVQAAKKAGAVASAKANILVDMVGAKDLKLWRETRSTKWLTDIVWAAAKRLGHSSVFLEQSGEVEDDHFPFLDAGIPSTDLIDLMDYPYWHNQAACCDDITRVAARSLQIVGDVIVAAVPDIEKYLLK
jgi:Zn-dependent M28 family amino/carboxypeptidase